MSKQTCSTSDIFSKSFLVAAKCLDTLVSFTCYSVSSESANGEQVTGKLRVGLSAIIESSKVSNILSNYHEFGEQKLSVSRTC